MSNWGIGRGLKRTLGDRIVLLIYQNTHKQPSNAVHTADCSAQMWVDG